MQIFQVILSISSIFVNNCVTNKLSKGDLKTSDHVYRFNALSYVVCILLFAILTLSSGLSLFTAGLGVLFGIVTALNGFFNLRALAKGPMNITLLITTSSMIIPTLSGLFFGESFSVYKFLVLFVLLFFIYLSLGKGTDRGFEKSWLFFCLASFFLQGGIGVLQKIHQSSDYKSEASGFLLVAFVCSLLFSFFASKKSYRELNFTKVHCLFALLSGVCVFLMNYLNLKLSGILPSQLFFPLINGSAVILSIAASFLIFKEKLTKRQIIGLSGGITSLILLCIVK